MVQPRKVIPIQTTQAPNVKPVFDNDPHVKLAEMFVTAPPPPGVRKQKNLTEVHTTYNVTRKNRVALIVAPEWTQLSPPYGIARMTALSRSSGFATRTWDINILTMHEAGCREYWSAYEDWKWQDPHYSEHVHPRIEPTLLKYMQQVCDWAPTVIGFSTWYTNDTCTVWMAQEFRRRIPGVKIVFGGANATQMKITDTSVADYIVSGEGELLFVKILENLENPIEQLPHVLTQTKDQRVDLDSMPPADYSDLDVKLYDSQGITSEFSRGCIANCVYCNETIFWKFRARQNHRVLDEIEIVYRQQGIRSVQFIDSLLNGNLKELREFAEGLIKRKIRVAWGGYSRIDGKMDQDFWALLQKSGASGFAFGVESGSQKVLDLMKKNCQVPWIEQNFRDLANIGLNNNFATWFTGFPGEELTDVAQTMTLMWRLRNSGMGGQSSGSCGLGHGTPLDLERERFGVTRQDWSWGWATQDMRNTVFHRFMRFKFTNILLEQFRLHRTVRSYEQHHQYPDLKNQYSIQYDPANWMDMIPWEKDFDYEIIKEDINPVANTLINEPWPLLRVLWLAMGAFKIHVEFEPERDLQEFGYVRYPRGGEHRLWATYNFEIDADGNWTANFDTRLQADPYNNQSMDFHHVYNETGTWDRPLEQIALTKTEG
jgi:hypothetical protein